MSGSDHYAMSVNLGFWPAYSNSPESRQYLREEELDRFTALIWTASLNLHHCVRSSKNDRDVSDTQFLILACATAEPELPLMRLRLLLGHSKQSLQGHLDDMEAKDWLIRRPHPRDKRCRMVQLTPQGQARFSDLLADARPQLARALRVSGADNVLAMRDSLLRVSQIRRTDTAKSRASEG